MNGYIILAICAGALLIAVVAWLLLKGKGRGNLSLDAIKRTTETLISTQAQIASQNALLDTCNESNDDIRTEIAQLSGAIDKLSIGSVEAIKKYLREVEAFLGELTKLEINYDALVPIVDYPCLVSVACGSIDDSLDQTVAYIGLLHTALSSMLSTELANLTAAQQALDDCTTSAQNLGDELTKLRDDKTRLDALVEARQAKITQSTTTINNIQNLLQSSAVRSTSYY